MRQFLHFLAFIFVFASQGRADDVCCEGFPLCFTDEEPYDHLPLPDCQDTVQATFNLFTRRNPSQGVTIQTDIPLPFVYDGNKRTAFVIHGWQSSTEKRWVIEIKNGLLAKEDMNVIEVDWRNGASYIWYPQSASNIRTTGAWVGLISQKLMSEGRSPSSALWCIGASLGAHTCGQAGRYVTFGRVTGLDPAGPLFENYDISTGLNPDAGEFVEALHSAGKGGIIGVNPGTLKPLGHVDFYPNGGGVQPGCDNYYLASEDKNSTPIAEHYKSSKTRQEMQMKELDTADTAMTLAAATPYLACSHNRATDYFIESMRSDCHFYARSECFDYRDIPESCESCGDKPCNELGYGAYGSSNHQGRQGLMYLETTADPPFCLG